MYNETSQPPEPYFGGGRVCRGRIWSPNIWGPSLLGAEFVRGRVCQGPSLLGAEMSRNRHVYTVQLEVLNPHCHFIYTYIYICKKKHS